MQLGHVSKGEIGYVQGGPLTVPLPTPSYRPQEGPLPIRSQRIARTQVRHSKATLSDTPREFPTRTANTVERAKKLKIDVDNKTETLLASSLMLSVTAKPVIDQFVTAHRWARQRRRRRGLDQPPGFANR
jgi:hypothetical protein